MASLSQLVSTLADELGDPEAGLIVVARSLREAGFIATGGRGRSAARMNEGDLASLLLATATTGDSTKAAERLNVVGSMRLEPLGSARYVEGGHFGFDVEETGPALGIAPDQSMLDVLTALLREYANGPTAVGSMATASIDLGTAHTPLRLQADVRPSEVSILVRHDRAGWFGEIHVFLRGGDSLSLPFSPSGRQRHPVIDSSAAHRPVGKSVAIRIYPGVTHVGMNCVRSISAPFVRRPDAAEERRGNEH